jgi:hypothetical protein
VSTAQDIPYAPHIKGLSNISRKTKEMSPDKKLQVLRLHQVGFKKTEIGKIIG